MPQRPVAYCRSFAQVRCTNVKLNRSRQLHVNLTSNFTSTHLEALSAAALETYLQWTTRSSNAISSRLLLILPLRHFQFDSLSIETECCFSIGSDSARDTRNQLSRIPAHLRTTFNCLIDVDNVSAPANAVVPLSQMPLTVAVAVAVAVRRNCEQWHWQCYDGTANDDILGS